MSECGENMNHTKKYFESFIENLVHAVKRVRDGDSFGAHMCLNGSLIHGSRGTIGDHSELPKGVSVETAICEMLIFRAESLIPKILSTLLRTWLSLQWGTSEIYLMKPSGRWMYH